MYGFENDRFLSVLNGAVENISYIEEIADKVYQKGFKNIYLVGSGGTYAVAGPSAYMLKNNSKLVYYYDIAAEVVQVQPKTLGKDTILITSSLSGTTQETIDVVKYANSVGATTIGFVGEATSPLGELVNYCVENDADNDNLMESLLIQYGTLISRLMYLNGDFDDYSNLIENYKKLPEVLLKVREDNDEKALAFAKKHKDTKFHMFVGAGNTFGETYCFAMCVLEEMQWIATKSIHAAEFFHGTIEMTDEDMSFVLIKGEDSTRPLVDRVENFVTQHSNYVEVFDTKDFDLEGISENMRQYVSPMVTSTQLERVSAHFEHVRNHSLDKRRFYRVVEY